MGIKDFFKWLKQPKKEVVFHGNGCATVPPGYDVIELPKIKVLYKKLNPDAQPPKRAHEGDAGWDITIPKGGSDLQMGMATYSTGLAFAVPKGYWLMAAPRSSVYKTGLSLANGIGIIDAGYRGEVKAMFWRVKEDWHPYIDGDRMLQLVLMPAMTTEVEFVEVDELPASWDGRDDNGFGSTGGKA